MMHPAPTFYSLKNFNILLVEDYDFIKSLIVSMLKAFGVGNVILCSNAREAIDLLTINQSAVTSRSAKPIDLVLTDWMMPDGMGSELIQFIRNHKSDMIRFMPVIMLSSFASERTVLSARDFGANEVLLKPVSAEKMASRILSIVNHPRPYIKAVTFFGPDRRRKEREWKKEERRKTGADQLQEHHEPE